MALEQQQNMAMAQRPEMNDSGMPMQPESQGPDPIAMVKSSDEILQRVQLLSENDKELFTRIMIPEVISVIGKVFGMEVEKILQPLGQKDEGLDDEASRETVEPTPPPVETEMAQGGGEGFANRPPEQPQGGGMVQRPQPV